MKHNEGIPYDGFGSVLEMLQKADRPFQERLLRNLKKMDPSLAHRLEAALARTRDNSAVLERSIRATVSRNYGQ